MTKQNLINSPSFFQSIQESIERLFDSSHVVIHSGEMVIGAVVAFLLHLIVTHFHCANYALFNHVIEAASSSWLQEQVADLSQSLCHFMPGWYLCQTS